LSLDEFESVRLACLEELKQVDAAKLMKISRSTFSRILASVSIKIENWTVFKQLKLKTGLAILRYTPSKKGEVYYGANT